jgi:hypothetical protein
MIIANHPGEDQVPARAAGDAAGPPWLVALALP